MNDKPQLISASFTFQQENNCNDSTGGWEELIINYESSLGVDMDEGFFVLRTEGWSVDSAQDLDELFERIKNIMKTKKK